MHKNKNIKSVYLEECDKTLNDRQSKSTGRNLLSVTSEN